MTDTGNERTHPPIPYGGDYQRVDDAEAPEVRRFKVLGGYAQLQESVSIDGELSLTQADVRRVEAAVSKLTPSARQGLSAATGAYLGDVLCSMHPDVVWESLGAETPVVRLSPKTTWDVFTYVGQDGGVSPDFMSEGLKEMERLLAATN